VAENLRHDDPDDSRLTAARAALIAECEREEENCLYTSTSFFIWLRWLKTSRAGLWVLGAIGSIVSANSILRGQDNYQILMAALAVTGVLMPGLIKALQLDSAIRDYAAAAASFKSLQGEFRRLARVWSNKPFPEFEAEARRATKSMNEARKPSLTPPEWCFRRAQKKIKRGDYDSDEKPFAVSTAVACR
jgi:hypothetical protein